MTNGRLLNTTISNRHGTAVTIYNSNITFCQLYYKGQYRFSNINYFAYGGGHIFFQGYNIFQNNMASIGGALRLYKMESMNLLPHTTLLIVDSHAKYVGGAIYSSEYGQQDPCFYNITSPSQSETVKMVFINNTAGYGGSSLYGGGLKQCSTYDQVINVTNTEKDPSAVAGAASDVCFCEQDKFQPNCSKDKRILIIPHVFPGQDFTIRLATVTYFTKGDAPGVVPGAIRAYSTSPKIPIKSSQVSQESNKPYCHNVTYSINTTQSEIIFSLSAEQVYIEALIFLFENNTRNALSLTVNLDECPLGFNLSSSGECECDQVLLSQQIECDINNQSFLVPDNS